MNIQEQEEQNFSPKPEYTMCLIEANELRNTIASQEAQKIQDALTKGLFVITCEVPHYCKATDAITGSVVHFHSSHKTREAANTAVSKIYAGDYGDYIDEDYSVLPILPTIPKPTCTTKENEEDIPF